MIRTLRRLALRALAHVFSDRMADALGRRLSRPLVRELQGAATDRFLELMLRGMDLACVLSRSYRRNVQDLRATYAFRTADGLVHATASFANGDMRVDSRAAEAATVEITFTDAAALRSFLFSREQDILNSLLANEVRVRGNLNYVYRFAFVARDLVRRLGMA